MVIPEYKTTPGNGNKRVTGGGPFISRPFRGVMLLSRGTFTYREVSRVGICWLDRWKPILRTLPTATLPSPDPLVYFSL
jgi:hypothetical protein